MNTNSQPEEEEEGSGVKEGEGYGEEIRGGMYSRRYRTSGH